MLISSWADDQNLPIDQLGFHLQLGQVFKRRDVFCVWGGGHKFDALYIKNEPAQWPARLIANRSIRTKGLEIVAVQRQLANIGWELGALWAEQFGKDCAGNGLGDEPGGTVGHHHVCTTGVTAGDKW